MFKDWFKRADTHIPHLASWQVARYEKQLKKAYEAGRKFGREEGPRPKVSVLVDKEA